MVKINVTKLQPFLDNRYISVQKHLDADLFIYNYTQKAQFGKVWTEETLMCRGLIATGDGTIVARPFKKFFNFDEYQENLPLEDFEIFEKLDGSLGILYFLNGIPHLATRGSFISDQALIGTEIMWKKYAKFSFSQEYTYLFEIIYADNKIVVDYGGMKDIVLLAIIHTETGKEVPIHTSAWPFPVVTRHDGIKDITTLKSLAVANKEGFVIKFASGLRLKVKFDEYVRLHRLVTGVNAKTIWEFLLHNQSFDELLERVPDEFYQWVQDTKANLEQQYAATDQQVQKEMTSIITELKNTFGEESEAFTIVGNIRKEFALQAKQHTYPHLLFSLLDKKDYQKEIWKLLRPKAEKPFKEEI